MPVINHRFYGQFFLVFPKIGYWNQHLCLQLAQRRVWFTLCSLHKLAAAVVFIRCCCSYKCARCMEERRWTRPMPSSCYLWSRHDAKPRKLVHDRGRVSGMDGEEGLRKTTAKSTAYLQYNFCMMSWNLSTLFVCWWTDLVLLCADLYVFSSSPVFRARRRLFFFLLCFSVDQVIISAIFGTVSNDI